VFSSSELVRGVGSALVLVAAGSFVARSWAEAPSAPKQSTVAPAAVLSKATEAYVSALKELMDGEEAYTKNVEQVGFKANAVTALALVLGNHDEANPYKAKAVEMIEASKELTRAKDYATAKAAWERLQTASDKTDLPGPAPAWERAASLGKLMKETSAIKARLGRNARRLDRTKDDNLQGAATLAAFAQAAVYDTHEVKNEADFPKWYAMMAEMRDAATALSKPYEAGDADGVKAGLDRLEKSCAACHEVFHHE